MICFISREQYIAFHELNEGVLICQIWQAIANGFFILLLGMTAYTPREKERVQVKRRHG
jgi:hypothetical protein